MIKPTDIRNVDLGIRCVVFLPQSIQVIRVAGYATIHTLTCIYPHFYAAKRLVTIAGYPSFEFLAIAFQRPLTDELCRIAIRPILQITTSAVEGDSAFLADRGTTSKAPAD